jgi:hypothetical protein
MDKVYNIYINSANKKENTTNYDYKLYFSNYNIIINNDEECYIYLKNFQTLNTFYNINNKSKYFSIMKNNNTTNVKTYYNFTLETGNYNCYEFAEAVNNKCSNYFTMIYDAKKNCFLYTQNPLIIGESIFIQPNIYNNKYFGFSADTYTNIATPINSSIINMNYFSIVIIKIIGIVSNNKTIDNFTSNNSIGSSDIFAIIPRQDAPINSLINFTDVNNAFMYKIQNNNLDFFNFVFYNENNELLTDLQNWIMILQIIVKTKK